MGASRQSGLVAVVILAGLGLPAVVATGANGGAVYRIVVDGPISPATADYIESGLDLAAENEASGLVIQLDTPGGLLDSTRSIVKNLLAAPVPVIVYVAPSGASATSAGVFVTLAAHVAAMAPGTTIGAAHPVTGQGGDIEGEMGKKVENFAAAFGESIAERRGRNVEWAERAVRESVSITEVEAAATNVIDLVAGSIDELLNRCQGRVVQVGSAERTLDFSSAKTAGGQVVIVDVPMTFRQRVLSVITHPNIAYLLMMAGMLGLYMEMSNPGVVFPGVVGAICLLLALLAMQVLPVNSTAVLLILLGMAFLIAELFMPSFGILGLGGLLALTLGSLFLYTRESQLAVDPSLVMATLALFGLALALVAFVLVRDRRRRSVTGAEGLIGEAGVTVGVVHGSGKVKVHGEIWNAISKERIEPDRPVEVEAVEGLRVRVREQGE